jgi:hypothetical protein
MKKTQKKLVQKRIPRCSYCKEVGHNIHNCNADIFRILCLELRLMRDYYNYSYPNYPIIALHIMYLNNKVRDNVDLFIYYLIHLKLLTWKQCKPVNIGLLIKLVTRVLFGITHDTQYYEILLSQETLYNLAEEHSNLTLVPSQNIVYLYNRQNSYYHYYHYYYNYVKSVYDYWFKYNKEFVHCSVCLNNQICEMDCAELNCTHKLCIDCCKQVIKSKAVCPLCRIPISSVIIYDDNKREQLLKV